MINQQKVEGVQQNDSLVDDRIKDILHTHYAAIEAPPLEWLVETFPGHNKTDAPSAIPDFMVGCARAWGRVLADWDAGRRLDVLHPPTHMFPWLALYKFNSWSRQRGEAKQHELIGMSSGRKDGSSKLLSAIDGHGKARGIFENEQAAE